MQKPHFLCKSRVEVRFWVHDPFICMYNLTEKKNDDPESLLILFYASLNMY